MLKSNQGKILLPAVMIRRKSVENNKDLATFNRYLSYETIMNYSEKNKYDRFDLMNKGAFASKPTKQIYSVSLPVQVNITYECIIWTDYVDQNNKLLEQINYAAKDYWGDAERFKFRARIDSYSIEQEINEGEDRNIKTSFDINVNAYLLNENYITNLDGVKNTTQKLFTVRKVMLQENAIASAGEMENISNNIIKNSSNLKDSPLDYTDVTGQGTMALNVNKVTNLDGYNKIQPSFEGVTKTPFHPAPKSITDYGENGWLAYDSKYIYVYQGEDGWVSYDGNYFYIYSAGQWRRIPISLFN